MPSISDVFNELTQANTRLQQLHNDMVNQAASTDAVKTSVDQVAACCSETNNRLSQVIDTLNRGFLNLSEGVQILIALEVFANQVLVHQSQQNDTIICILERVSVQTCNLLNEAHLQTGLQTEIKVNSSTLLELYKSTQPGAAVELERLDGLRKQLLECCPPEPPKPVCEYEPCPTPKPLSQPRRPDFEVFEVSELQ